MVRKNSDARMYFYSTLISVLKTNMKPKSRKRVSYKPYGTPAIILSGKFIGRLGFTTGSEYYADYKYGQITLVRVGEESVAN